MYYTMKVVFQISKKTMSYIIIASQILTIHSERLKKAGQIFHSLYQNKSQINI